MIICIFVVLNLEFPVRQSDKTNSGNTEKGFTKSFIVLNSSNVIS